MKTEPRLRQLQEEYSDSGGTGKSSFGAITIPTAPVLRHVSELGRRLRALLGRITFHGTS